jgi:hypothetical protein
MGCKYFKGLGIACRILMGTPLEKRSLGRLIRSCEHILKMDMRKTDFTDVSFISGSFIVAAFGVM